MLKGIDRVLSAELLMVLMSMGHGDDILICDVNHPAATIAKATTHGKLINMSGCDLPREPSPAQDRLTGPVDPDHTGEPAPRDQCVDSCRSSGRWASPHRPAGPRRSGDAPGCR